MRAHGQISLQVPDTFSTIKTSDVSFEIDFTSVPSQILWNTEQKPRQVEERGLGEDGLIGMGEKSGEGCGIHSAHV